MTDKSTVKVFEAIDISEERHNEIIINWNTKMSRTKMVSDLLEEINNDDSLTVMEKIYIAYIFGIGTG